MGTHQQKGITPHSPLPEFSVFPLKCLAPLLEDRRISDGCSVLVFERAKLRSEGHFVGSALGPPKFMFSEFDNLR